MMILRSGTGFLLCVCLLASYKINCLLAGAKSKQTPMMLKELSALKLGVVFDETPFEQAVKYFATKVNAERKRQDPSKRAFSFIVVKARIVEDYPALTFKFEKAPAHIILEYILRLGNAVIEIDGHVALIKRANEAEK